MRRIFALLLFCECFLSSLTFARAHIAPERNMTLQIISNAYRKHPYIQVPSPWIDPRDRLRIVSECSSVVRGEWEVEEVQLTEKQMQEEKWFESLKCHPAATIAFNHHKSKDNENSNKEEENKEQSKASSKERSFAFLLLIYPKSYRSVVEDPLIKKPLTIEYLGSVKYLAFYSYNRDQKKQHPFDQITKTLQITRKKK